MITDAEFWMETRRNMSGGDCIFKGMLALIHARQAALDSHVTAAEKEEYKLTAWGRKHRDEAAGRVYTGEDKKEMEQAAKQKEAELKEFGKPLESNKAFWVGDAPAAGTPLYGVASGTLRVLQQVMLFAVPIYALRYNIPAMSMSWNTSCFIDRRSKQLITFGAGHGVKVPQHLRGRGCVAGDGFFAILSNQDEVWSSGGLKVSSSSVDGPTALGREDAMTGIAGKTLMLVGHGQRLAIVTRAFTVRPLSALSNPTRSIIPARHVRFLDLGYADDYYMVGTDSIVYKTTASKRAVSTPRRVMTLCRTPVSRVASGTSFLLIIDQNGHLYTFGRNKKGQLGNGAVQDAHRKPYLVGELTHHFFVQVAAGDCHSLALTSNGVVYGAGSNDSGQLGLGRGVKEVNKFTPIPLGSEGELRCIGIAAGPAGSMFYCDNGQVFTCGLNDSMQLGVDTADKVVCEPMPVAVLVDGVESYTMDFGGFRRPDGEEPLSTTATSKPEAGANAFQNTVGAGATANSNGVNNTLPSGGGLGGSLMHTKNATTVINISDSPTNNNAAASAAGAGNEGNGMSNIVNGNNSSSNVNGLEQSGSAAAKTTANNTRPGLAGENHQPVEDPSATQTIVIGPDGKPQTRLNVNNPSTKDGANKEKKAKGKCGCCTVM